MTIILYGTHNNDCSKTTHTSYLRYAKLGQLLYKISVQYRANLRALRHADVVPQCVIPLNNILKRKFSLAAAASSAAKATVDVSFSDKVEVVECHCIELWLTQIYNN